MAKTYPELQFVKSKWPDCEDDMYLYLPNPDVSIGVSGGQYVVVAQVGKLLKFYNPVNTLEAAVSICKNHN